MKNLCENLNLNGYRKGTFGLAPNNMSVMISFKRLQLWIKNVPYNT
jgi:hypothetical protein